MIRDWWRGRTRRARVDRPALRRPALCLEAFEDRLLLDGRFGLEVARVDLSSVDNPTVYGQYAVFVAVVSPEDGEGPTPTGTVEFQRDGVSLGFATLDQGTAWVLTNELAVGAHSITALYDGDASYLPGASEALVQNVDQARALIGMTSYPNPSFVGQHVYFATWVYAQEPGAGVPTGTIQVLEGTTLLGEAELDEAGVATLDLVFTEARLYVFRVVYSGDENFESSVSADFGQTAVRAETSTRLALSAAQAVFGQPVTLSATVTVREPGAGRLDGTVTFRAGGVVLGTATADEGGVAALTVASVPVGTTALTATYEGNSVLQGSTSAPVNLTVTRAASITAVDATPNPSAFREPVTFSITVAPRAPSIATPTGTVTLLYGNVVVATGQLVDGVARLTVTTLFLGRHTMTARFEGSAGHEGSSGNVQIVVGSLNERWVSLVYFHLLGRVVDAGGLVTFTRFLDQGVTHTEVALRIMRECGAGCEFFTVTVRNLYRQLLRREADPGGLAGNVEFLRTGGTIGQVKARLLGSAEYFGNMQWGGGSNNSTWLTALYRDVLDRAPTPAERSFWLQVLGQGADRESVALSLVRNAESLGRVVNGYLFRLLGRQGTPDEIAGGVALMQGGRREEEIIASILASGEYLSNL